jgi:hypothetical protein
MIKDKAGTRDLNDSEYNDDDEDSEDVLSDQEAAYGENEEDSTGNDEEDLDADLISPQKKKVKVTVARGVKIEEPFVPAPSGL